MWGGSSRSLLQKKNRKPRSRRTVGTDGVGYPPTWRTQRSCTSSTMTCGHGLSVPLCVLQGRGHARWRQPLSTECRPRPVAIWAPLANCHDARLELVECYRLLALRGGWLGLTQHRAEIHQLSARLATRILRRVHIRVHHASSGLIDQPLQIVVLERTFELLRGEGALRHLTLRLARRRLGRAQGYHNGPGFTTRAEVQVCGDQIRRGVSYGNRVVHRVPVLADLDARKALGQSGRTGRLFETGHLR